MAFSLLQPLSEIPICVIDVETTGVAADLGDRVIELGIVRLQDGQATQEYQQLFDPGRAISPRIEIITGITPQMLSGQPRFCDELDRIMQLLAGAVLLGHNVGFDLSFLRMEFRRAGREMGLLKNVPVLDTLQIARRRFGRGGNALGRLADRLGISCVGAHRALADARTTHLVFERLMEPIGGWKIPLCDCLIQQGPAIMVVAGSEPHPLPVELAEALELRRPVLMHYLDVDENRTQRVIEPLEVRRFRGEMVLVAHCRLRNDRRHFKVDRIVELQRIDVLPSTCAS
jgi:DNA polymerase-3 subunit epsilon